MAPGAGIVRCLALAVLGLLLLAGCDSSTTAPWVGIAPDPAVCARVTGDGPEPWWEAQVSGEQFDAYEGERMRIVVSAAGREGVAEVTLVQGWFGVRLPDSINHTAYTEVDLYVDLDDDDACDVGEPLWGFVTGGVRDDLVVEATPGEVCVSGGGDQVGAGCRPWLEPAGQCVVNGQADLTMPLSCSP